MALARGVTPREGTTDTGESMPPRPSPHHLGAITAYATRPPTGSDPRWYWQARVFVPAGARETLWVRRARRHELDALLGPLVLFYGLDPAPPARFQPRDPPAGPTVGELVARWLAFIEADSSGYAKGTLRNYRSAARRLERSIGRYALAEVSPFFLDRYRRARRAQGVVDGFPIPPSTGYFRAPPPDQPDLRPRAPAPASEGLGGRRLSM